ncbi:MAG: FAD-dependent oxidoreductase [Deltaproteobacteria bacterium]|nr:FAD-dependent oxidoreductase [Deltaproteobacteria bacterium]
MAIIRTHRPVWNRQLCIPCGACSRRCPASVFTELADEQDSLRGRVARLKSLPKNRANQPPCQRACPLGQDVPGYVQAVAQGDIERAYQLVIETNPLPSVCGRVCSHPCMQACVRSKLDQAVEIRTLKRVICENSKERQSPAPEKMRSEKVVVIGAGPAGLSASYFLARSGYSVDLYEAKQSAGGRLRAAALSDELPADVIESDIELVRSSGVKIQIGSPIQTAAQIDELLANFGAVVLAVGAGPEQSPEHLVWLTQNKNLVITPKGSLQADSKTFMTSQAKVFACGEVMTGPRDLIRVIASGKRAARAVDQFIQAGDQS